MKEFFVVFLVAGTLTLSAQLSSLPIGSTNAVLEDAIAQANEIGMNVTLLGREEDDYAYKFIGFGQFPYSSSAGENIEELIRTRLVETLRKSIDTKDTTLKGRNFVVVYSLDRRIPNGKWYILLGTHNEFSLVPNEKGELTVPESAYTVDLVAALMRGSVHAFFVEGIDRALLQVKDEAGKIVVSQDSRNGVPGDGTMKVRENDEVLFLPITFATSGQDGALTVWYKNGSKRVHRLNDGALFPQLEIVRKSEGLELTVLGADDFIIESSPDLVNWGFSYLLVPLSGTPPTRFLEKNLNGNIFYRVRVSEPALQKR